MIVLGRLGSFRRFVVRGAEGEVGRVEDAYFDERDWVVRYLAVGLTGAPGMTVLVAPGSIAGIDEDTTSFRTDLTRRQIAQCPAKADLPPVSRVLQQQADDRLRAGSLRAGPEPSPEASASIPGRSGWPGDGAAQSHLRSGEEVTGYMMVARDGVVGHVLDLIVELPDWRVRYLEVEWRGWHPAQRALVEPRWVSAIDWLHREVTTDLDRKGVAAASARDDATTHGSPAAASYPATTSSSSAVMASCLARR